MLLFCRYFRKIPLNVYRRPKVSADLCSGPYLKAHRSLQTLTYGRRVPHELKENRTQKVAAPLYNITRTCSRTSCYVRGRIIKRIFYTAVCGVRVAFYTLNSEWVFCWQTRLRLSPLPSCDLRSLLPVPGPFSSRSPKIYDERMAPIGGKAFQRPTRKIRGKNPVECGGRTVFHRDWRFCSRGRSSVYGSVFPTKT